MSLPSDFDSTLKRVKEYGIFDEDPAQIQKRLELAMDGIAAIEGGRTADLGAFDWAARLFRKFQEAVHQEICDPKNEGLNDKYRELLEKGLTTEGVTALAAVVTKVIAAVNPAFAVSSVVVFLSVWLLKIGLNQWCRTPLSS